MEISAEICSANDDIMKNFNYEKSCQICSADDDWTQDTQSNLNSLMCLCKYRTQISRDTEKWVGVDPRPWPFYTCGFPSC